MSVCAVCVRKKASLQAFGCYFVVPRHVDKDIGCRQWQVEGVWALLPVLKQKMMDLWKQKTQGVEECCKYATVYRSATNTPRSRTSRHRLWPYGCGRSTWGERARDRGLAHAGSRGWTEPVPALAQAGTVFDFLRFD